MKKLVAFAIIALLLPAVMLKADVENAAKADLDMRSYNSLKDDDSLFVGEGIAEDKDFGGDQEKAIQSAEQLAREDLAQAIRVRVQTRTSENLEEKNGVSSQEVKSQGQSQADVVLENVKVRRLTDFPKSGEETVLAYLSKEDYRRQLAGKGPHVFKPEIGLRVRIGTFTPYSLAHLIGEAESPPGNASTVTKPLIGQNDGIPLDYGLDFTWASWVLGFQLDVRKPYTFFYTPGTGDPGSYNFQSDDYGLGLVQAGYDWTPWGWRVEPFAPLRLEGGFVSYAGTPPTPIFGASAGLGLRYWPNDSLAFELSGVWHQGFNSVTFTDYASGQPLYLRPGETATFDLTGLAFQLGLLWSGF